MHLIYNQWYKSHEKIALKEEEYGNKSSMPWHIQISYEPWTILGLDKWAVPIGMRHDQSFKTSPKKRLKEFSVNIWKIKMIKMLLNFIHKT